MQNSSPNQMLMLLTRLGENSKVIITGDLKQRDKLCNGLNNLLEKLDIHYTDTKSMENDGIVIHTFSVDDVQRSGIVKTICGFKVVQKDLNIDKTNPLTYLKF